MKSTRTPAQEQYRLIMECRQSGLTDHQWCVEHDIKPGTFYNWVKRLRQKGCADLPSVTGRSDIVKITLHFFLKDVRPMQHPLMKHNTVVS